MASRIGLKISLGFGAALFIMGLIGAVSYYSTLQFMGTVNWVAHTYRILDSLEQVLSHAKDIDIGVRGYLLTGDERYLEPYHTALVGIDAPLQKLLDLTTHHPEQHLKIASFQDMITTRRTLASDLVALWRIEVGKGSRALTIEENSPAEAISAWGREPDDVARLLSLIRAGKLVMDEMRTQVRQIKEAENALLQQRTVASAIRARSTKAVIVAGSGLAFLCVALAGYIVQRDLTGRRRAEETAERLRRHTALILDSAGEGIVGIDRQGRGTFVNPAAARMVGYSVEELIGQPLHILMHHSKLDGTPYPQQACPILSMLQEGQPIRRTDEVYWRKDGTSFPVEYMCAPLQDRDEILGAVVIFQDISERLAVERMQNEFVSVVSHELRTPLTSVRGSLGLLASGQLGMLPEQGQRMLDIAVNNTDRLVRLINDILDLERMELGKITLAKRACTVEEILGQAVEVVRNLAEKADITLAVVALPASLRVWGDPDRLVQTMTNLLGNAIKFSPSGTMISVSAEPQPDHVVFQVRDQGRGIPADKLGSIFERFQQVDASDSREKGGTGLGLAICRSIVQQHGGRIWAESLLGEGSTFSFTLPLLKDEIEAVVPSVYAPIVLVCDDDPAIADMLRTLLGRWGYRVVTATSGQEAVEQAVLQQPNLILLDLVMPGMSGWEVMAALKAQQETKTIPIVVLSVLSEQEGATPTMDFAAWVHKPFDDTSLWQTLEHAMNAPMKMTRVLIVEDDLDLAKVLVSLFERHGIQAVHAQTGLEAIRLSQRLLPDLLVLDIVLPEADGFAVVDWLRHYDRLQDIPLVVYSAKDLDNAERERLMLGRTQFMTKGRVTPEEFEKHVLGLLNRMISKGQERSMHVPETYSAHR